MLAEDAINAATAKQLRRESGTVAEEPKSADKTENSAAGFSQAQHRT